MRTAIWQEIAGFEPVSFALVMATGIISNAFLLHGFVGLADALFLVNLVAYAAMGLCILLRIISFPGAMWNDLSDPRLVFSFFTIVAGSDVVGIGLALRALWVPAVVLWLFALGLWLALTYFGFGALMFLNNAQRADLLQGGWLLAIVGTESSAILATTIAPRLGDAASAIFVLAYMLWGLGLVLYGIYITLLAGRMFFAEIAPEAITPALGVVMGAAAIGTNAGAELMAADFPLTQQLRPFLEGATLVSWAWASWTIPLLVMLFIWKYAVQAVRLRYTPLFWSLVFPLGMYDVATLRVAGVANLPGLLPVSTTILWLAFAAWAATALAALNAAKQRLVGQRDKS